MLHSKKTVCGFACLLKNHINRLVCLFCFFTFLISSYQTFFDVINYKAVSHYTAWYFIIRLYHFLFNQSPIPTHLGYFSFTTTNHTTTGVCEHTRCKEQQ